MDNEKPGDYPRRILLAVTGLSPQIVTETLYALAVGNEEKFIPTEVHIISTESGAEQAKLSLLSQKRRWFKRLLEDYNLPAISFAENHIHTVKDVTGLPLNDIRTQADNEQIADYITEIIREFSADKNAALHVSIAGGRKTMGFYLGYALSLYGRAQDRLSHVLVSEPYESSREFFYPTPYENSITLPSGQEADTQKAKISLADIPFVRMRHGLPGALVNGKSSFMQTVNAANENLGPARLVINPGKRQIQCGTKTIKLEPAKLAFYLMFARNRQLGREGLHWATDELAPLLLNEYAGILGKHHGNVSKLESNLTRKSTGSLEMSKEYFDPANNHTNKEIRKHLPSSAVDQYLIQHRENGPYGRYSLSGLKPEAISIVDE